MAGGKSTQPLFELLAKGQSDALTRQAKNFIPGREGESNPPAPAPPVRQESPSRPAVVASPDPARRSDREMAERQPSLARRPGGRTIQVPILGAYVGAGVLVGVLFIAWSVGFHRGKAAERAEWQGSLARGGVIGADPLIDPSAGAAPVGARTGSGRAAETGTQPQGGGKGPSGTSTDRNQNLGSSLLGAGRAGILTSGGVLSADPRQPGRNYLKLATLGRADAERSIQFLASGGVEAIGVPVVDPKAGAANNPARYEVFATVGITGEEYANNRSVRTELEAKVARIGERFKREAKGPTDFSKPLWMKHNP